MTTAAPDESTLRQLQELVAMYENEDDAKDIIQQCLTLLKKRRTMEPSLVTAIQRVMLQTHLQQKEYQTVVDFVKNNHQQSKAKEDAIPNQDLALYAHYRLDAYETVSQQAVSIEGVPLEGHLLAQSQFHLQKIGSAVQKYQKLLSDHDDDDEEGTMELLTNATAALASSSWVVPYAPTEVEDASTSIWNQATNFLSEHPEHTDLAMNVGTLEALTTAKSSKWLQEAKENCEDNDGRVPIDLNLVWSEHFWQAQQSLESNDASSLKYDTSKGTEVQRSIAKLNQALQKSGSSVSSLFPSQPHPKWNILQTRLYWYNRAILQFHAQQYVPCQESCQSLRKTLTAGSKKKKGSSDSQPSSPSDWWWHSRIDVLLAYLAQKQQQGSVSLEVLKQRLEAMQAYQPTCDIVDHAIAYAQLHLLALQHANPSREQNMAILQALPASLQSQPAVLATLEVLGAAKGKSVSKSAMTPQEQAEDSLVQGKYAEAASQFQACLPEPSQCSEDDLKYHLKCVQALALDGEHEESTKLFQTLAPFLEGLQTEEPERDDLPDGDQLETRALPRSTKTSTLGSLEQPSSQTQTSEAKLSKEKVLRRRAKRREAYLKQLQEKGDYNPDRPTPPNPERWIPKFERSSNRRRKGNQVGRSAQGGGSASDALKLDAAARRAGTAPVSSAPSTANMKVSNTGSRKGGRRR